MRELKYLSPSSFAIYEEDRELYYMQYLCEQRLKRDPQTAPMSVGSAFDAYAKSFLHDKLVGDKNPKFAFQTLFEAQVEPQNRDVALKDGKFVFDEYLKVGALAELLLELNGCLGKPRFESDIEGYVEAVSIKLGAVPLLGKPDLDFTTSEGLKVIHDWKTTGFYANSNYSPKPGYIRCLPKRDPHKDCFVMKHKGFKINTNATLDKSNPKWATQLCIYAWLLGNEVGSDFVVAIDEIVVNKDKFGQRNIRVAQHRALVDRTFQNDLFSRLNTAWYNIQRGHIFDTMSLEASQQRCKTLDEKVAMENSPKSEEDLLFDSIAKPQRKWY